MRNYRIRQNTKNNNYKVEGQYNLLGLIKCWITYKDVDDSIFGDWYGEDYLSKWWWWFNILSLPIGIVFLNFSVLFFLILGIIMISCGFVSTFFVIVDGLAGGSFHDLTFGSQGRAKEFIEELEENEEMSKKIEKEGKSKVVGVYLNGEFIDGERLERMKKLERIVDE